MPVGKNKGLKYFFYHLNFLNVKKIISLILPMAYAIGRFFSNPTGLLTLVWTDNQAFDAPTSSGTVSIAQGGTGTLNADTGVITVTGLTAASGAIVQVTVNNNKVAANSTVLISGNNYSGTWSTNGEPMPMAATITGAGVMVIRIGNFHPANALSGNLSISFRVGQPIV